MKHKLSRILALTLVLVMAICTQAVAEGKTLRLTQNVEMDTMDSGNTGDVPGGDTTGGDAAGDNGEFLNWLLGNGSTSGRR